MIENIVQQEEEEDWEKEIEERDRIQHSQDSSGREIFVEADLLKPSFCINPHASIIDVNQGWAHIKLLAKTNHLDDTMKKFLRSPPRVKRVCAFKRAG